MKIVFTDLDGTLIDFEDYSYDKSADSVRELNSRKIPLIFTTGKTPAENMYYREKLDVNHPFITENGSAIYIPRGYFDFDFKYTEEKDGFLILQLGVSYGKIEKAINEINRRTGFKIRGRVQMSDEEVAADAHMTLELARPARQRRYSDSFRFSGDLKKLEEIASEFSLKVVHGGKYYSFTSDKAGKGRAVRILSSLYEKKLGKTESLGIGDSRNDIPMLKAVDIPVLVSRKRIDFPGAYHTSAEGPEGFSEAIEKFITGS